MKHIFNLYCCLLLVCCVRGDIRRRGNAPRRKRREQRIQSHMKLHKEYIEKISKMSYITIFHTDTYDVYDLGHPHTKLCNSMMDMLWKYSDSRESQNETLKNMYSSSTIRVPEFTGSGYLSYYVKWISYFRIGYPSVYAITDKDKTYIINKIKTQFIREIYTPEYFPNTYQSDKKIIVSFDDIVAFSRTHCHLLGAKEVAIGIGLGILLKYLLN